MIKIKSLAPSYTIFQFLLILILIPTNVAAELVQGSASGTVEYAHGRGTDIPGSIKAGDPLHVTWHYDTDYAIDLQPTWNTGIYQFAEPDHEAMITIDINGTVWSASGDELIVTVADNANNSTLDAFIFSFGGTASHFPGLLDHGFGEFRLNDSALPTDMLNDGALPTSMSDISFSEVTHAFGNLHSSDFYSPRGETEWFIHYNVDLSTYMITAVPEPSIFVLLGIGLVGLGLRRKLQS